jgi:hypothetical protein
MVKDARRRGPRGDGQISLPQVGGNVLGAADGQHLIRSIEAFGDQAGLGEGLRA